jgi:hypothetical protein
MIPVPSASSSQQQSPFSSIPSSLLKDKDSLIVDDLNIAYNRVMRMLHNALKRKPRVADSARKKKFGNEVVVLQSQLFRTVEVTKQLCCCLFGASFEQLMQHEIYSQSKKSIIVHIHTLNRFSNIFRPTVKNEPFLVELKSGEMMGCTARVAFFISGRAGQGNGYVVGEFSKNGTKYIRVETDAILNVDDSWNTDESFDSSSSEDDEIESKSNMKKTKRTVMELVSPSYQDGRWKSVSIFEGKQIHIMHYYPIRMRINLESYTLTMTINRVSHDNAFKINH